MRAFRGRAYPVAPLLHAYTAAGLPGDEVLSAVPGLGERWRAIRSARGEWLNETFLDATSESEFQQALARFYDACVPTPLHLDVIRRRSSLLRHGVGHLLRGRDPLPQRLERCLAADGPYHVPGLGPAFWSGLAQALDPLRHPAWLPSVLQGLRRLGLLETEQPRPSAVYAALLRAYQGLRSSEPNLTAGHIDHFLSLVAVMPGRDLWTTKPCVAPDLPALIRQERSRVPLRRRLKKRSADLDDARRRLEAALGRQDGTEVGAALSVADPVGYRRARLGWKKHGETLTFWVGRLWEADNPDEVLREFWLADPIPWAGLWLPAAVLHLRNPDQFFPWDETSRQGFAVLDDAAGLGEPPWVRYRLYNEGLTWLRNRHRIHPLEVPALLA